ncbi:DNA polymerase subunit Cdc27 [Halteromyces radiatus]|uniref:DNA polymerase subunit Cdc27 n=1 Tax=Halteromyces radiatus TaxID=101107 RepID=UPI00221E3FC4|nr:DNA polymerase subunit Cdc27 [Halteromyces radiatus]KAI8086680.1 DNA polymerase subunit Cdc27 [Halteromyces radiatus]
MEYKAFLDTTILQEKRPVTYRSLARSQNIHVNVAKQALYHYTTVESSAVAIYCLTGTLADNTLSVRLVNQADLQEMKKRYRQITGIHVYSVLPYDPKDLSVLVTTNTDMVTSSLDDKIKNGLIQNKSLKIINNTSSTTTPAATQPPSVSKKEPSTAPVSSSTTKKPAPAATKPVTPSKRKGTLSFAKASSQPKKQAVEAPKTSPSSTSQPRKVKTIQESDDDESEDEEELDARLARSAKIEVDDIFSDDGDDDDEAMTDTGKEDNAEDKGAPSPTMDVDEENETTADKASISSKSDEEEDQQQEQVTTPGKVRRKVQKKKTYKNERGFLVTEDVWEWEEVDADEVPKTSAPSPKKTPPSTPSKKTSGQQKNLLSFWGKR